MAEKAANKNKYTILLILVIVFFLIRLSILLTSIDKIHIDDELYRGNIAKEVISGPILPFFDYQRSEYEGSSLIMGVLSVPLFLLFGDSLFSLKLTALFFSIGILIAWYLFLYDFFNKRIAVLTSLLFIFSPPYFTKFGLCLIGSYFESGFFTIVALFIFYRIFFIKESILLFALLGLVCGFALFYSYVFSITLLVILLFLFLSQKRFFLGYNFLIFVSFFLLGFSPWIYYNLTHNFEGFIVADKPIVYWFSRHSWLDSLLKFRDLALIEFAASFGFEDLGALSNRTVSTIYYVLFAFPFCALVYVYRKSLLKVAAGLMPLKRFALSARDIPRPVILIVFFIVYCIIFSMSRFDFKGDFYAAYVNRYRYLIPTYPFIFALSAVFYDKATVNRKSIVSYAFFCCLTVMLFLGCVYTFNLISFNKFGQRYVSTIYKGYNYYDLGKIICWRYSDAAKSIDLINKLKRDGDRRDCFAGMGWGFSKDRFSADYGFYLSEVLPRLDTRYWPDACDRMGRVIGHSKVIDKELADKLDIRYHPYFYHGVGAGGARSSVNDFQAYNRLKEGINPEYLPFFHQGMGSELFEVLINDNGRFTNFIRSLDQKTQESVYRGIAEGQAYYRYSYDQFGLGIGSIGYNVKKWNKVIDTVPEAFKSDCYQRLGIEAGWRFIHDVKRYNDFLEGTDAQYRPDVYRGLGMGIGWRFVDNPKGCSELIRQVGRRYQPYVYTGLSTGVLKRSDYKSDK